MPALQGKKESGAFCANAPLEEAIGF